ncbi:MAG: HNH endonuclease signature motif containing protein [Patescibacteria group bacterium]
MNTKFKKFLKIVGISVFLFVIFIVVVASLGSGSSPSPVVESQTEVASSTISLVATTTATTSAKSVQKVASIVSTSQKAGASYLYPDPKLTPGAVFPVDASVICVSGYTAKVRDVSVATKKQVYAEYGVSYPQPTGANEVDHFIPLEIGGSNDIKNLWLEPANPTPGFHQKDVYENYAHKQVCDGEITLTEAQKRMADDWYKYYLEIPKTSTKSTPKTTTVVPNQTTPVQTSNNSSVDTSGPEVKKSSSGICHEKGSQYYDKTQDFTPYTSLDACLASGGRLPK